MTRGPTRRSRARTVVSGCALGSPTLRGRNPQRSQGSRPPGPSYLTPLDGAFRALWQPLRLAGYGCWHTLPVATTLVRALIRAGRQERITSPLTVAYDLQKRRVAQR